MNKEKIVGAVDHTLLGVDCTWEDIRQLCDEAVAYQTASVCIPACYVREAADYLQGKCPVCTVIGFPNGYSTQTVKVAEARDAIANGASEIDMVINIGFLKSGRYDALLNEIKEVKKACSTHILKVIIETCLLTEAEKIKMCEIISLSGADYIKTSTGFSKAGATKEDVSLFRKHVHPHVKIKAAGGVRTLEDAQAFLELGASRLGTSSIVKLLKKDGTSGY